MANESITFLCPACGIKLTVPGTLAGVVGPCPSCRTLIQAPFPPAPPASVPAQAPAPVPAPVPTPAPLSAPAYQPPVYQPQVDLPATPPVSAPVHIPVTAPIPVVAAPEYQSPPPEYPITDQEPISAPTVVVLRPEPRQLPSRTTHGEPVAKPMPEPSVVSKSDRNSNPLPKHPHQRSRFSRFLLLFLFLIGSGGIVFGVLTLINNQTKAAAGKSPKDGSTVRPILPPDNIPPQHPVEPPPAPALPVPLPEQPAISEPPPALPAGLEPKTPSDAAREVLDRFLAAKSLAERLPMIEARTSEAELANSCLAGPLPAAIRISIDALENNLVEQVTDFYHNVDFDAGENRTHPHTLLVRVRGSAEPKVVVDPFLDSYGGRLAAYAKTPSEKAGTFQVIIWPLAACYDERVPNREKKLTLKLLPRDNTKEIAQAYFGRQSNIAKMLEDGTYSLSYGKAKACTVVLRWNQEDSPENPYLEAIDLKTLDWNP